MQQCPSRVLLASCSSLLAFTSWISSSDLNTACKTLFLPAWSSQQSHEVCQAETDLPKSLRQLHGQRHRKHNHSPALITTLILTRNRRLLLVCNLCFPLPSYKVHKSFFLAQEWYRTIRLSFWLSNMVSSYPTLFLSRISADFLKSKFLDFMTTEQKHDMRCLSAYIEDPGNKSVWVKSINLKYMGFSFSFQQNQWSLSNALR